MLNKDSIREARRIKCKSYTIQIPELIDHCLRTLASSDARHLEDLQKRLRDSGAEGDRVELRRLLRVQELDLDGRALVMAAENGMLDVAERLLRTGRVDPDRHDREGMNALYEAAARGLADLVESILRLGDRVDVNKRCCNGLTALSIAAWRGRTDVVRLLLDRKDIKVDLVSQHVEYLTTAFCEL